MSSPPVYKRRMETSLSEAEAVGQARHGDAAAFAVLVRAYEEPAFRAAYLVLRDAAAAEDVAQDAFVRAYGQLSRFREGEAFKPWLLRIVTNLALNELRSRRRRTGLLERFARLLPTQEEPAPEAKVVADDEAAAVSLAMNRLKEEDRVVLYLCYYLELDEKEMAQAINRPQGTVKSRLHRASERLRRVIEADYPELREGHDR